MGFLKNAEKGFEDEQILDLTEDELLNIMSRRPEVTARKVMDVLIRWGKKKFAVEAPKPEPKKEEPKKEDEKKEEEKKDDTKKEEEKKEEEKEAEKKEEDKKEEDKKDTSKTEEKVEEKKEEKKAEEKVEEKKVEEKPAEIDLINPLKSLVEYVKWDHADAPYYLKEIRGRPILSMEAQNSAMTQMLQAFVDNAQKTPQSSSQASMAAKMGPKSAQPAATQRGRQQGQKRDNSQECEVITERISKNSRTTQRVKEEHDIL